MKRLEIGPGADRLPGFETLNISPPATYVGDCRRTRLPSDSFDLVYSSHCIEHVLWFEVEPTIAEWARLVKPGGELEVHTVNGYALMKALVDWEDGGAGPKAGKWREDLHGGDPFLWGVGRIICYPKKGSGDVNVHRAIITPKFLRRCFERAGLSEIEEVAEPRGAKKHRGINMGLRGRKC